MEAHEGQRDRDGNAVILHPLLVGSMGMTDAEKCVGFLHDVVEDTDWTFDDLRNEEIPEEVIEALQLCTHDEGKDYFEYVRQIIDSGNMTAIHVKQNDLRHNIARGKAFGYTDLVEKHEKALQMIEDFLQKIKYSRGCPII
jgi:(p)ppGpp synthase/HD superfamily hydrolase